MNTPTPAGTIVVVGGVAGGMSCAARARRLDEHAKIVVLEKGSHVSFANCGLPYYVGGEIEDEASLLVQTPASLHAALDLEIHTDSEVVGLDTDRRVVTARTPEGLTEFGYDALVLSPGAETARPPVPGLDSVRVAALRTVDDAVALRERVMSGARRAVVLGGGFIGVEAAEALAGQGLDVTIVELAPHVLPPVEPELAHLVTEELRRLGITVRSGVAAARIDSLPDRDVVHLADGTAIEADLVLLSAGVRPDTALFSAAGIACHDGAIVVDEHGRTSVPGVWAVGDATAATDAVTGARRPVALAGPANRAGRLVADAILRPERARPLPAALGTAIVRVGEQTVALTGANRRSLDAAGIRYRTIHLHPNHHAGYFPGATQVHLVIQMDERDGALLGAQAVGRDGVDKRIDVLATALRAAMTAPELMDLDLAYSPVYGQAKDPVNLAGMLAANVLDGTVRLWYSEDLDAAREHTLVLDVRTAAEYERLHLPGVLHIPHTQLRDRLSEVREHAAGRPVRVLCQSGVRSAIAHRVLVQEGFDSASLSGGMLTLQATLGDRAGDVLAGSAVLTRA